MTIQSRKRVAEYAFVVSVVLFLYSFSFENDSCLIRIKFVVSKTTSSTDDYPSFFAPPVPNEYPTKMMNRAFQNTANYINASLCFVTSQVQVLPKEHDWVL
jgi:hypothetical protein